MGTGFAIATVPVEGGGRIGVAPLPGRFGDLLADVAAIALWNPEIVVSMTTKQEMAQFGAGDLKTALADADIAWFHLPICDYGGPRGGAEEAWPALSIRLHGILEAGGGVLLHCRGGHGRSGMIALRLLIERGEPMVEALARLRVARPGAVEGQVQLDWAAQGARGG